MCLWIDKTIHGNSRKAIRAPFDIVVWKVLRRSTVMVYNPKTNKFRYEYYSPFYHQEYMLGKKYQSQIDFGDSSFYLDIGGGLFDRIENALHANYSQRAAKRMAGSHKNSIRPMVVLPAIIPKGSRIYLGQSGDIASTQMIVYRNRSDLEKVHGKIGPHVKRTTLK